MTRKAMRIKKIWTARAIIWILAGVTMAGVSTRVLAQDATPKNNGETGLAERLAEAGQNAVRVKEITDANWAQSAALLEAAMRLAPAEARFARLRVDAELGAQNLDAAAETLRTLLTKLDPADQGAQVQLIELFSRRMETAEARIKYLQGVSDEQSVPAEVRSYAAMSMAQIMNDRFQKKEALAAIEKALNLNAYNAEALRLKYLMIGEGLKGPELAALFITMLRANPSQPDICARLARELADLALPGEAATWYDRAIGIQQLSGLPVDPGLMIDFAANLFCRGQADQAGAYLTSLVEAQPRNVDAWFLKLAIEKGGKKEQFDENRRQARMVLMNRLAEARQNNGVKQATTRPLTSREEWEIPDLAAEVAAFDAQTPADVRGGYVSTLADLAWFSLYYDQNAADARKALAPLTTLMGADKPTVARLEGWAYLLENKTAEARQKLSAVAEADPLAALGLLRLDRNDPARKDKLAATAEKLWSDNPRGLVAAIIWSDLRDMEPRQLARPGAEAYLAEVHKLPPGWMNIAVSPQAFYTVTCQANNNGRGFGWPVIARVTLQNLSEFDIPVSPAGTVRPDLWVDVRFVGASAQLFADLPNATLGGVAYERMSEALVLKGRSSVTRDVRVDQGPLAALLAQRPTASISVNLVTQTNPLSMTDGIVPGPAGQRMQSPRTVERGGTPMGSDVQRRRIYQAMAASPDGDERLRCIDLLEAVLLMVGREPANSPSKPVMAEIASALQAVTNDPSVNVQAWGRRTLALIGDDQDAERTIRKMADSEDWQQRLVALLTAQIRQPELGRTLARRLSDDPDATVKRYAVATETAIRLAATRPATAPATRSATMP